MLFLVHIRVIHYLSSVVNLVSLPALFMVPEGVELGPR